MDETGDGKKSGKIVRLELKKRRDFLKIVKDKLAPASERPVEQNSGEEEPLADAYLLNPQFAASQRRRERESASRGEVLAMEKGLLFLRQHPAIRAQVAEAKNYPDKRLWIRSHKFTDSLKQHKPHISLHLFRFFDDESVDFNLKFKTVRTWLETEFQNEPIPPILVSTMLDELYIEWP